MRKESTENLCFSSRLGPFTEKRVGGEHRSLTPPQGPGSALDTSGSLEASPPPMMQSDSETVPRKSRTLLQAGRNTWTDPLPAGVRWEGQGHLQSTEGRAGHQALAAGLLLSWLPVPLRFVRGMKTDCCWVVDTRSCKQLGCVTHMCRLLCHLGDRRPERALVVSD